MRKLELFIFIFILQITKIFSQQGNATSDFYIKFNNCVKPSLIYAKEQVIESLRSSNIKFVSIEMPFKSNKIGNFSTFFRVAVIGENEDLCLNKLSKIKNLERIEKVIKYKFYHTPNDPKYAFADTMWHLYKINAAGGWNYSRGNDSVVIAIVDDNVEITHPDLQPNLYANSLEIANDGVDNDTNGYIDDTNGADVATNTSSPFILDSSYTHGTKVAGCANAYTNNGIGIASTGYACKTLAVKCTDNPNYVSHGLEGLFYAASLPDVQVVNLSWGDENYSQTMQDIIDSAMFYKSNKIVFVAAAGNTGDSIRTYPAACNNVIAVTSTDKYDNKMSTVKFGNWVDLAAPGIGIYTTKRFAKYGRFLELGNYLIAGTSFSAPIVAGAVGLMFSINKNLVFSEILNCLTTTADPVNVQNTSCNCPMGKRLNLQNAMQCICLSYACPLSIASNDHATHVTNLLFSGNKLKVLGLPNSSMSLLLYDVSGKEVFSKIVETNCEIDLSNYVHGFYIAKLSFDQQLETKKIVLN